MLTKRLTARGDLPTTRASSSMNAFSPGRPRAQRGSSPRRPDLRIRLRSCHRSSLPFCRCDLLLLAFGSFGWNSPDSDTDPRYGQRLLARAKDRLVKARDSASGDSPSADVRSNRVSSAGPLAEESSASDGFTVVPSAFNSVSSEPPSEPRSTAPLRRSDSASASASADAGGVSSLCPVETTEVATGGFLPRGSSQSGI